MAGYEIWTDPEPGENALRHEYRRWNEDLDDVIADAKRMARGGVRGVRVVLVSTDGDRRMLDRGVLVMYEAGQTAERRVLTCKRCGTAWEPRVGRPVRCPSCKSPLWDQDRVRAPRDYDAEAVTELIGEYRESGRSCVRPIVLQWQDTGEYEIIPEPYLSDVSWSDRSRPKRVIGRVADLEK